MKLLQHRHFTAAVIGIVLAATPLSLYGQATPELQEAEKTDRPPRRWWIGVQLRVLPFDLVGGGKTERSIENPATSWTFTTTPDSAHVGAGLAGEFVLTKKITLRAEFLYHRLGYSQTAETYTGTDDPDTSTDERSKTTLTERTKASQWDFPLMVRYHRPRETGILSKTFLSAGGAFRSVAKIRTGNETTFPDNNTAYNEMPTVPMRRNFVGTVVGAGFRFVDDFNIKVTPEVRYTRWFGSTFDHESTHSQRNQFEIGVGLTF